jgi:RHS repeat-associated protein
MMFSAFEYDSAAVTNSWQETEYSYGDSGGRPVLAQIHTVARTADETVINETASIHAVDHDAIGNVTNDGLSSYTYDLRNKLVEQADAGGPTRISFRYDSKGLRVLSEAGSGTNTGWMVDTYLQPDGNPFLEVTLDDTPAVVEEKLYIHQGNRLLAVVSGTSVEHVVSDHIAYPIATISDLGAILWHADHRPFGEVGEIYQGNSASDPLRRYPGQWQPDVGVFEVPSFLFFNGHRWYNPSLGIYIEADPIGLAGGDLTLFGYALQNPLRYFDFLGLAVARCQRPISDRPWTIPDGVIRNGPNVRANPVFHEYICVSYDSANPVLGTTGGWHCGGQTSANGTAYGPGAPSRDVYREDLCEEIDLDDELEVECFESCIRNHIHSSDRPWYGAVGPGKNCQEWIDDVEQTCSRRCRN